MEDDGVLDPMDEIHMFVLHFVFISRVQQALGAFHNGTPILLALKKILTLSNYLSQVVFTILHFSTDISI